MCKFASKSGGVPFQISFFGGDLTRNELYIDNVAEYVVNKSIIKCN